jgi:hypothetical protein
MPTPQEKRKRWPRRIVATAAMVVGGITALLVAVFLLLSLSSVRRTVLAFALPRLDASLPGSLHVGQATWPAPGSFDLIDVAWTDGPDTLLSADRIFVSLRLRPLLRRDVLADSIVVERAAVDIPAISARFAGPKTLPPDGQPSRDGFPRAGSLPPLPSVAVEGMRVSARTLRLNGDTAITGLALDGGFDFASDHAPRIRVDRLTARGDGGSWGIDSLALDVDLEKGRCAGSGRGSLAPDWPLGLTVASNGRDSLSVVVSASPTASPPDTTGISLRAKIDREGLRVRSLDFVAAVRMPTSSELARLPWGRRLESVPLLDGLALRAQGTWDVHPTPAIKVDCDIAPNDWLDSGRLSVAYDDRARTAAASIDAHLRPGRVPLEGLRVDANVALATDRSSSLALDARVMGFNIGIAASIDRRDDIDVRIAPVVVQYGAIDLARLNASGAPSGRIRYSPTTGAVRIEDLRVIGVAGEFSVSARLDSTFTGAYNASGRWLEPPDLVLRKLDWPADKTDSLRASWRADGPYQLNVAGDVRGGDVRSATVLGSFSLPGPRAFSSILPDSARVGDLGPLRGEFTLQGHSGSKGAEWDLSANLDATEWIDASAVHLRQVGRQIEVDTLGIVIEGLALTVHGGLGSGGYDLSAHVAIADSAFVQRFVSGAPAMRLVAGGSLMGTREELELEVLFEGSLRGDGYRVPTIRGRAAMDSSGAFVLVSAPHGVATSIAVFDSVSVAVRSMTGRRTVFPARVVGQVAGKGIESFVSLVVDTTAHLSVTLEDFRLAVGGMELNEQRPCRIARKSDRLEVDDLHLAGPLGMLRVAGSVGRATTDLKCDVAVTLPQAPLSVRLPDSMWPERLEAHVEANDHRVTVEGRLTGFELAHGLNSSLDVAVVADNDSVRARVTIADNERSLIAADVFLPATVSPYPPTLALKEGPLLADVVIDQFPMAFYFMRGTTEIPKEEVARIRGRLVARGTTTAPTVLVSLGVSFPEWPKISVYDALFEARLGTVASLADNNLLQRATRELPSASGSNIVAAVSLNENGKSVLFGALRHPATLRLNPFSFETPKDSSLHAILHSDGVPLDRFDPILPADVLLAGLCVLDLSLSGATHAPDIHGRIKATDVKFAIAQKTELSANGDIEIAGTTAAPKIAGGVVVTGGLIRIPEAREKLHPAEGKALLRPDVAPADTVVAVADSLARMDGEADTEAPAFDMTIRIPSNLFIRGRGLDVELAGDLHVTEKRNRPVVTGELRATKGNLVLLGRSLKLERGTVTFYGGPEINPALDVALSARIEATRIEVLVAGTARKPSITLRSEPDMKEGDIISVLLFGRAFDDLSDDEADLVQQRTTEMVAALGAAELQKNLSAVDVVSYRGADEEYKGGTLTFGKYLNPDVLLSYVHSIDDQAGSFVSLEYFLKGSFKVDTVYGKRNQTGLGIGWVKDY